MRSLPATLAAPVSDDAPSADDLQLELAEAFENTIENTMALSLFEANTSARLEAVRDNLLMPPPSAEESTPRALPAPDKAAAETAAAAAAAAARGRATGLPRPFESELAENGRPTYRLHRRVQRGAHGEVWRAVRTDDPRGSPLVLKRLLVERGPHVTLSGLRERHFGLLLKHEPLVARFVDAFEVDGSLWLVFKDEGVSLHDLLYTTTPIETGAADGGGGGGSGGGSETGGEGAFAVQLSPLWLRFRRERSGAAVLRQLLRQGMTALARLHARNVTHRDLAPANILGTARAAAAAAAAAAGAGGGASAMAGGFSLRLGDFGSAVDAETLQPQLGLYGAAGPTVDEETAEYQPPEASSSACPEASDPTTYDLWSFGIVVLEALLGTPLT